MTMNEANLIEDVKRYQSLYEQEVDLFKGRFMGKLQPASAESDSFIDELSQVFADQSIRLKVLEAAVRSELFVNQEIIELLKQNKSAQLGAQYFQNTLSLKANDLEALEGFAPAETNEEGVSYCWSIDNPEIRVPLLLDRSNNKALKVRFVGEVKPELISSMQLWVDGIQTQFDLGFDGEFNCLTACISESSASQVTQVVMKLQGVYSPEELSQGGDKRKLGIAIESISADDWVAPKVSLVRRVGRRVKRVFA